ncbi:DUF2868 domain-containing protein [Sinimarinibacterium sp. NLF-5-8]|uniref:DUF2868 domain-containing protein n=1 Tax=Sinimarinibacterium sp. NLF-5-8 TaxID=2698684 RepID=UPI00137C007A|nr:DUF2868 domain-containing protein [Sinimarinibacterium sp. NLF-5-8]QHS09693.1 DUF2868 domain-containing protein [Sinimarinibacterium sp. NLF-5-8]
MAASSARAPLARLWRVLVCLHEERQGHPDHDPEADAAAIAQGGDLLARAQTRALHLSSAESGLAQLAIGMRSIKLALLALLMLAALSGMAASASALSARDPANLPWLLLILIGSNLAMLLVWLLLLTQRARLTALGAILQPWLAPAWRWLQRHNPQAAQKPAVPLQSALPLLLSGARARWLWACLSHALWLAFALGAALCLLVLLSAQHHELSWRTTLLTPSQLQNLADALSLLPAAVGMTPLSVEASGSAADQHWARWLIVCVLLYGAAPRALALTVCLWLLYRACRPLSRDAQRPGYARLRARLFPSALIGAIVDPGVPLTDSTAASTATPIETLTALTPGHYLGLALDMPSDPGAPQLDGIHWQWLGAIDSAEARARALQAAADNGDPRQAIAVIVNATHTPDRGIERFVAAIVARARAPVHLLLDQLQPLQQRGAARAQQRLSDWRDLAQRAGARLVALP